MAAVITTMGMNERCRGRVVNDKNKLDILKTDWHLLSHSGTMNGDRSDARKTRDKREEVIKAAKGFFDWWFSGI
ncbi:MAG: hypothetical protein L6290_04125 [Thermodesulfovibrionales bacterium]|nr:hypothetical protein [Thermodesulfovibrionales bacterium]